MNTIKLHEYTVHHDNGLIMVDRYNEKNWRNCIGDGLILALVQRIETLEEQRSAFLNRYLELFTESLADNISEDMTYLDVLKRQNSELIEKLRLQL